MSHAAIVRSAVLVGFESVGKSALFRGLNGQRVGDETNFRGSTVACRRGRLPAGLHELVDTPGIGIEEDAATTRLALAALSEADIVVLVARATDVGRELDSLTRKLALEGRPVVVVMTFRDKVSRSATSARLLSELYGVAVVPVNARRLSRQDRDFLLSAIQTARHLVRPPGTRPHRLPLPRVEPSATVFDAPHWGAPLALLTLLVALVAPVVAAFSLSERLQPLADAHVVEPMKRVLGPLPPLAEALLTGPYGLLTLGPYSFVWAFPVVALVGLVTALGQESGLHDHMTTALDPWLRRIGLTGRDLGPLLTGFGCNVVAVMQSRACSACSRKACVSAIAFGSACSYQIGATLSLFGSAGLSRLFVPYLLLVFVVGVVHTRLWYPALPRQAVLPRRDRAFLQMPSAAALMWRIAAVLKQFLKQAMPIFLSMCVLAALLAHLKIMDSLAGWLAPALNWFGLPPDVALPVLLSFLRKDGVLLLNQGQGELLGSLGAGQIFITLFLAGTLSACVVTLWTIRRELGLRSALAVLGRQALTSLGATAVLAWICLE